MRKLNIPLPTWFNLTFIVILAVGALWLVAQVKSYIKGPDLALTTIYRPKPVPVPVTEVKWMTKVKTERINVPVEVYRDVPAPVEKRLDKDFGIKLDLLRAENKELAKIVDVPKSPHGGAMAITVNTGSGAVEGIFRPNAAPLIEFGGIREVGADYEPLAKVAGGYYRQDLLRVGPAILNGKAFVKAPIAPGANGKGIDYGISIGVAVRF
jgi:hypothetical protein